MPNDGNSTDDLITPQGDQENTKMPSQEDLMRATSTIPDTKEINYFRDQTKLNYGDSIPQTDPVKTETPLRTATEIAMAGQGMAEQVINQKIEKRNEIEINNNEQKPTSKTVEIKEKDPAEIVEYLKRVNSAMESLNKLREQYPDNKDIQEQINRLIGNISENIKTNTSPNKVQEELKPEEKKDNKQEEDRKQKERATKKAALIAGVIGGGTGFGVAVAFGAASAVPASIALVAGTITTYGAKRIGERVIAKTENELKQAGISQEEKGRLEKKLLNWNKVYTWATHGFNFFKGFGIGLVGGSFVSKVFFSGQGLIDKLATGAQTTQTTSGIPENKISVSGPKTIEQSPIDTTHASSVSEISRSSISPTDTGLVQNGRVNLPGSAWDGNLAGSPTGTLPGGELLSSNFTGGQYDMAAYHLNKDLAEAGLRVSDLTSKMGTEGVHRLLNGYLNAIRGGTSNPVLRSVLESSNITGASDVLSMIP